MAFTILSGCPSPVDHSKVPLSSSMHEPNRISSFPSSFHLYRSANGKTQRLSKNPIKNTCDFVDRIKISNHPIAYMECLMTDIDPDRPGMEVFLCLEPWHENGRGVCVVDIPWNDELHNFYIFRLASMWYDGLLP